MKKATSICLILALFVMILPVQAATKDSSPSIKEMYLEASNQAQVLPASAETSPVNISAQLKNDAGETYDVSVFEYTPAEETLPDGSHAKVYVYSTDDISPNSYGMIKTDGKWDNSYSVYGYLKIIYNSRPNGNYTEYLLTNVSGYWERSDSTVTIRDRYVAYTCQYVFTQNQVTWKYPTSNSFNYNTGYTKYVPNDNTTSVLGAQSSVTLLHGSASKWTLNCEVNVFNNDIGDLI